MVGSEAARSEMLLSRNAGIVSTHEQATLRVMHVLVAGVGSVGGSVVEPLARLGVGAMTLADPERYDWSNLNRQSCITEDIGRFKAAIQADRVRAINPRAQVWAVTTGVTLETAGQLVSDVHVVFDGVDSTVEALPAKWALHEAAAKRAIPVVSGADFGGKPTLYVWDYRDRPEPFYGKASRKAFMEGREVEVLRSWMRPHHLPSDFIPVVRDRIGSQAPWPQVVYCVMAMGALGSRAVLQLAMGRRLPHVVTIDIHDRTSRLPGRLSRRVRWPVESARTLWALRRANDTFAAPRQQHVDSLPEQMLAAIEAIRNSPSGHNTQPWSLRFDGVDRVSLGWNPARQPHVVDGDGRYVCFSLGCAVEAAARVTHHEFEPEYGPFGPAWTAGTLHVAGGESSEHYRAAGVLALRATTRLPFQTQSPATTALDAMVKEASFFDAHLTVLTDRRRIEALADRTREAAASRLRDPDFLDELLEWTRLLPGERPAVDGFTPATLALDPLSRRLLETLKRHPGLRGRAQAVGLAEATARKEGRRFLQSGAVLALSSDDDSPSGRVRAGRALLGVWLAATEHGLAVQPVNFALDALATRAPVLSELNLTGQDTIALVRVGYCAATPPPSPRLPLDAILQGAMR